MRECIFCKIIQRQFADEEIVIDNENCLVFIDKYRKTSAGPICLVVPKRHITDITEINDSDSKNLLSTIKQTTILLKTTFKAKGVRVWQANGQSAGQSIFHLHFHIVPCNSIIDRIIAIFPITFDIFRRYNIFSKSRHIKVDKLKIMADKMRANI